MTTLPNPDPTDPPGPGDAPGDGIETPLEIPIPPDLDIDVDAIVAEAQALIDGKTPPSLAVDPDPADADTDDADADDDTDPPDEPTDPPSDEASTPPDPASSTRPSEAGSGEDPDPEPPAPAPPASTTDPDDEWDRVGTAWETLHGRRPTFEDLTDLSARAANYDAVIGQIQALPDDQRAIVAEIIEGRFDPAALAARYAPTPAPTSQDPADPWAEPSAPRGPDPTVEAINSLRDDFRAREAAEHARAQQAWQQQVQGDLARLNNDLIAANPHLSADEIIAIDRSVNQAGVWVGEVQRTGDAYDTYRRHFLAHATARGVNVVDPASPRSTAPVAPEPSPVPATTNPPTEQEQAAIDAQAQRRQAAAGAVAGSSTPTRTTRRRSAIDSAPDTASPGTARTGAALEAELAAEVERLVGR